jgi:glycine/D-amino acid oxidase-like deaminating enzyme
MQRRNFLFAVAAAAGLSAAGMPLRGALAASKKAGPNRSNRVVVIGAGIIGASIAYHLSKRGCEVIVVERRSPAAQASGNSFAWINASYVKQPFSYHLLSTYSLHAYHRLAKEADFQVTWGGCLEWVDAPDRERRIAEQVRHIQKFGSPTWMIDAARAKEIDPNVVFDENRQVAYSVQDGGIDGRATTRVLLDRAVGYGATLVYPANVTRLEEKRNGVRVTTDREIYDVDTAVLAAGVGASRVARTIDLSLEQRPAPGIIVRTEPMAPLINTVIVAPGVHIRQASDGRVIVGEQAGPPGTESHQQYLTGRPNSYPTAELAKQHADRILEMAQHVVPQLGSAIVEHVGVGWRPMPLDGLPVVGHPVSAPGVYLAVMHSGITLAPIIGHLASMEILDGVSVEMLRNFRFERF